MEMLGRRLAYSAVPEGDGGPSRARRLKRAALLACVVGASVAVASRGSAWNAPPELYSAASDDDWPTEEMGTASLDGVDVNIILSRPTRTSVVISCWCAAGSTVYVDYWERAKPEPVNSLSAPCGAASLVLEATGLSPGTKYSYVATVEGKSTAAHAFATAGDDDVAFTVSGDAHLYSSAANRDVFGTMAAKVAASEPDFHVQLGCSWMLDKYADWEGTKEDVFAFVRGTRYWYGALGADTALYNAQGPHSGENFEDYSGCFYGEGLSNASLAYRAQWSVAARLESYPAPEAGAFYAGSDASDS